MKAKVKLITVIVSLSVAYAFAADWPGYLGPQRDSTSVEKGLLRTWPKEGPKVLWTARSSGKRAKRRPSIRAVQSSPTVCC